jgi:hypothetical protein
MRTYIVKDGELGPSEAEAADQKHGKCSVLEEPRGECGCFALPMLVNTNTNKRDSKYD